MADPAGVEELDEVAQPATESEGEEQDAVPCDGAGVAAYRRVDDVLDDLGLEVDRPSFQYPF